MRSWSFSCQAAHNKFINCYYNYYTNYSFSYLLTFILVGHFLSKLWHDIRAVFSHVYLKSFLQKTARISCSTYTCVLSCFVGFLFPSIWPFSYKRAYICAQKVYLYALETSMCICGHRKVVAYDSSPNYTVSKKPLHVRWSWKVTSVWIKDGRSGRVNFEQGLVRIHCPHSSGGCWPPDNGFVGIRGLSLKRLCTPFHKCWPKQRSIQLEINVRQTKHNS